MKFETFRDRKFNLLLYPLEDLTHKQAIDYIKSNYEYAMIVHDKDKEENGELKKSHVHIVITVGKNQKYNTGLAKDMGITPNYIEKTENLDKSLEYLIHYNNDDKYQYDINEVEGTLKTRLEMSLNSDGKSEGEKVLELIEVIENADYLKTTEFAKYCAQQGKWDIYRRSGVIFNQMIKEHNYEIERLNSQI